MTVEEFEYIVSLTEGMWPHRGWGALTQAALAVEFSSVLRADAERALREMAAEETPDYPPTPHQVLKYAKGIATARKNAELDALHNSPEARERREAQWTAEYMAGARHNHADDMTPLGDAIRRIVAARRMRHNADGS